MSEMITTVTDDSFDNDVLASTTPVVVDFWAPWCGPCKALTPIVEEVAQKYTGKVKFVKINIDDNPQSPSRYGVRGIPTLILFNEGQVVDTHVGLLSKADLTQFIDKHD